MPSYTKQVKVPGRGKKEIYDAVESHIDRLLEKFSVGNPQVKKDAQNYCIDIQSSMFSAKLSCRDGEVALDGKLSLLATPFKKNIDEGIDRFIAKYFGPKV